MAKSYSIYGLVDPRDNQIFYVGRTGRSPKVRYDEHMSSLEGCTPKEEMIREIVESFKGVPSLVVLENGISSEKTAFIKEVFWIEMLSKTGSSLRNASIDFDGKHFLTDLPMSNLPEQPPVELDTYLSTLDMSESGQDFFRIESLGSFTPINHDVELSDLNLAEKRSANAAAGRLFNAGLPITEEEIDVLVAVFEREKKVDYLEEFFQRSRKSLISMLERRGIRS